MDERAPLRKLHAECRRLLEEVYSLCLADFSAPELSQLRDYIEHNENGLALDTAIDCYTDARKAPPPAVVAHWKALAEMMNYPLGYREEG